MAKWESPDGTINKEVLEEGDRTKKPYENSICTIKITDIYVNLSNGPYERKETIQDELRTLENTDGTLNYTIGDATTPFTQLLDEILQTMGEKEISKVTFWSSTGFLLQLVSFQSDGVIFEWKAPKKVDLARKHKDAGVELFNNGQFDNAIYRFVKGVKIIASVPVDVEEKPSSIDGVPVKEMNQLKANLYNNLASCYLKKEDFDKVIVFSSKVLHLEKDNVKALYKIGVAYAQTGDYERAGEALGKAGRIEPENKAVAEKFRAVSVRLHEANEKVNAIVRKMFS